MISSVFLKSTVTPLESVIRPSSRICKRTLNTSGCAFSTSSQQDDRVRLACARPRSAVRLRHSRHIPEALRSAAPRCAFPYIRSYRCARYAISSVKQLFGQRLGHLRLAHAGRAKEQEASQSGGSHPGSAPCCRRMASRDERKRLILADDPLAPARPAAASSFLPFRSQPAWSTSMRGPSGHDLGDRSPRRPISWIMRILLLILCRHRGSGRSSVGIASYCSFGRFLITRFVLRLREDPGGLSPAAPCKPWLRPAYAFPAAHLVVFDYLFASFRSASSLRMLLQPLQRLGVSLPSSAPFLQFPAA